MRKETFFSTAAAVVASAVAVLLITTAVTAQSAPSVGRYVDNRRWSTQDCMTRARTALQAEGFVVDWTGVDAYRANKAPFTVIIMCSPTPESMMRVNVVLAANGGNIPAQNDRLWARMDNVQTGVETIDWNKQADPLRGRNGTRFTYQCKPGGPVSGRLWGTDVYTDDSSICSAAAHAGLITVSAGGRVTIEIRPGQSSYKPSIRNGVTSLSYGGWSGSFVFVR